MQNDYTLYNRPITDLLQDRMLHWLHRLDNLSKSGLFTTMEAQHTTQPHVISKSGDTFREIQDEIVEQVAEREFNDVMLQEDEANDSDEDEDFGVEIPAQSES